MKQLRWPALLVVLLLTVSSAYAAPACPAQPTNADGTTIASPVPDQVVTSPVTVQGQYFGSFEGVVPIQILDSSGAVLRTDQAMNECCKLAPYERKVTFNVAAPTSACIVVYRESGADGSLTPLAQVPVTLTPAAQLPGTGAETSPLALPLGVALALVSGGLMLRRRMTRHP
jgi:LPXTG-motif cell wall-anchored protein